MGIDRIGKGGAPPIAPETGTNSAGVSGKGAVDKTFSVERTDPSEKATATSQVHGTDAASPLARLRSGEIDVHGYVDLKVDEATKGLAGLSRVELHDIREMLRDQMVTDPGLADLVRTATGKIPSPPSDEG